MQKSWSQELVTELLKLRFAGQTASQIGRRLGITRSAVMGKLHRLGVRGLQPDVSKSQSESGRLGAIVRKKKAAPKPERPPLPEPPPPFAMPSARGVGDAALRELQRGDCRWPIGDPRHGDFRFCGAQRDPHSYYCEHHYVASINPDYTYGERQWPDTKRIWRR